MSQTFKHVVHCLLGLLLMSCGGGGGDAPRTQSTPLPTTISGTVFDAAVRNGTLNIYDWSGGAKGAQVGSVVTDSHGKYSLTRQTPSTVVLFEIDSGFYFEEATNTLVQLDSDDGKELKAVVPLIAGSSSTVQVTGLTTIATGLAEFFVASQGMTAQNAAIAANEQISAWVGFDILTTEPVDVLDTANATTALSNSHQYGFVAAAFSELTKRIDTDAFRSPHTGWTSSAFYNLMYKDIRADGVLDGLGAGGSPLLVDSAPVTSETYRTILAERLLQFVLGTSNNTTLDFNTVLPFASKLNLHTAAIFAGVPPATDIRDAETRIVNFLPPSGVTISGSYSLNAKLTDKFGIVLTEYFVDGLFVARPGSDENPLYSLNTLDPAFGNGAHTITIEVTNILDNTSSLTHNITIQN